jgi:hypothetical protein
MLLLTGPSRLHRSFCDAIKKMRVYTFLFGIIEVFICRQLPPRDFSASKLSRLRPRGARENH